MELLGAKVHVVTSGTQTLKDAVNETMREWTQRIKDTHYVLGSVMGPHPFPTIIRDFQSVIGREVKQQMLEKEGKLPDALLACVGGGSNAMGLFYDFIEDSKVRLIGCEAAGHGVDTDKTAATMAINKLLPRTERDFTAKTTLRGTGAMKSSSKSSDIYRAAKAAVIPKKT